jgi:hypothetical protein
VITEFHIALDLTFAHAALEATMTDQSPFYREDLSKYENRINWALFGCLAIPELKRRFLECLRLDPEVVIRPELVEGSSFRPDFAIRKDEKTVAYIEVELGDRDKDQDEKYAAELKEPTLG